MDPGSGVRHVTAANGRKYPKQRGAEYRGQHPGVFFITII